ncbi:MAG TPA: hypothetical protein VFR11_02925 [Micromonosporaceae bacterium]|jgi:hypothetical protein|nr:hypothetical protein [Micromonosporaceae bacterium]
MTVRDLEVSTAADDRVLPFTRGLSAAIVGFLVVAFAVLYPWPTDTGRLFAWHIVPTMTAMVLGSAYLGGAYFFVRVATALSWHTVKAGFLPVALFASLLGVATIVHWNKFLHGHVAFWLWAGLYFTTPFLVFAGWLRNRRVEVSAAADDPLVPASAMWALTILGAAALITGAVLYLSPATAMRFWPWQLTPLTARTIGAVWCLGVAGVAAPLDRRWTTVRIPLQTAAVMMSLMFIAGIRASAEFDAGNALTWLLAVGFVVVITAIAVLSWRMERRTVTR